MKLVTVATHIDGYMPWLVESSKRYNIDLVVLGLGEKWEGYNWKFLKMKEFLKSSDPEEVICFIDAYDVIVLRDLSPMKKDFLEFCEITGKKIVVGCDQPKPLYMKTLAYFTFGKCDGDMLNSGSYIGKAGDLLNMITEMQTIANNNPKVDDQVLLKDWCNFNTESVYIDCENTFFLVTGDPYFELELDNKKNPYILHAPGNTYINNIIEDLGYTMSDDQKDYIDEYHQKAIAKKVKYYSSFPIYKIVFLIVIFVILYRFFKNNKYTL
jgi:hypothetical protein